MAKEASKSNVVVIEEMVGWIKQHLEDKKSNLVAINVQMKQHGDKHR